jgi:hypothetical protein
MDPIGSSPVFIHKDDLRKVAPIWHDTTLKIKSDPEVWLRIVVQLINQLTIRVISLTLN